MNCLHYNKYFNQTKTLIPFQNQAYNFLFNLIALYSYTSINILYATYLNTGTYILTISNKFMPVLNLLLNNDGSNGYFVLNDLCGFFKKELYYCSLNIFNIFLNQRFIVNTQISSTTLYSLSSLYLSAVWVERELSELDGIYIQNLRDTRRLLQDYTLYAEKYRNYWSYKTEHYSTLLQDLLKVMLYWNFYFLIFIGVLFLSFLYVNKSFLQLLILTEIIIISIFLLCLNLSALYNIIYLINFSLILLILGGLELALAFLLLAL